MQQPLPIGAAPLPIAPTFYLTRSQPIRPGAILLATVAAVFTLSSVVCALGHNGRAHLTAAGPGAARSTAASAPPAADKDDPNQIDTIVLGDPADAPTPARHGDNVSDVHPFVIVHLPRFGDEAGLIPNTEAGRLLYAWLAAFNHGSYPALGNALPTVALAPATAAQIQLREQTGGFALLSAKEVQPGVLVFRLRDQTTQAEALGTLQLRPGSSPAAIASFSLRAVTAPTTPAPGLTSRQRLTHQPNSPGNASSTTAAIQVSPHTSRKPEVKDKLGRRALHRQIESTSNPYAQ